MSDTKWTPGPWEARHGRSPHVKEIVGPKREAICATHNWLDSDPVEESRANANLIAAAPGLYEALETLVHSYGHTDYLSEEERLSDPDVKAAMVILAKARGDQ